MSSVSVVEINQGRSSVREVLAKFTGLFNELTVRNIDDIRNIYSQDVSFQDPFSTVYGLDPLADYFSNAYANVIACNFEFGEPVISGCNVCIPWVMKLRHKRIRGGKEVQVDGISQLCIQNGRVTSHRDYFDAGQLLYEHLPVLGKAIQWIRSHAG